MSRRRITLVSSGLSSGGSELQLVQLACGLSDRGWQVSVVSLQRGGRYRGALLDRGIAVEVEPVDRLATPLQLARLARRLGESPRLVHTQAFRANLWGRLCAQLRRRAVVASVRATYSYLPRSYHPVERLLAARTGRVVTPAAAASRYLVDVVGLPANRVVTIENGVDTGLFAPRPDRASIRRRHRLTGRFAVLVAARLVSQKNHALLLEAWEQVAADRPEAMLLVAGAGPLEERLRQRAATIAGAVRFVGELGRTQLAELLGASDAFALTSNFEGSPNALLEAMASGRAVVATAVDGTAELIEHGVSGLLVPPGDTPRLALSLAELARTPRLRRSLGEAARRRVEARHGIEANVRRHVELYEAVLAEPGTGPEQLCITGRAW